jgi:hypothetical protein
MILKTHTSIAKQQTNSLLLKNTTKLILGLGLFFCTYFFISMLWVSSSAEPGFILLADAEKVEGNKFVLGAYKVLHSKSQSSDFAYQGNHSVKLGSKTQKYGFSVALNDVKVGDKITAQVWAYSPNLEIGYVTISGLNPKQVYAQSKNFSFVKDWQLLEVSVSIDKPIKDNTIKIYCFNFNNTPVYFDNLSYTKNEKAYLREVSTWEPENIHVFMKQGAYMKLKEKRYAAIQRGLLVKEADSWVKGAIYPEKEDEEKLKVSMRLKGDWTDHLQGEQWSFRVETQTDKSWNRLKTFSLQVPATRSYLHEWLLHEMFKYEDILTTRYEFVNMKLNDKSLGLYVYEEHFLKQLPEYNKRKEGPIVRFEEGGYWEAYLRQTQTKASLDGELLVGSPEIKPFEEKKTINSPVLAEQFVIAQNLLYQYQYGLKPAKEIFDIDMLARYYVIADITGGYHGIAWHNQRYYYNPVTGKLEPIGFDGFGEVGLRDVFKKPFIGIDLSAVSANREFHMKLFRDEGFLEKYMFYLEKMSNKEYLQKFVARIGKNLNDRLSCIVRSKPAYKFDVNYIYQRASNIQNALYPTSASLQTKTVRPGLIAVCNRHQVPIKIIGSLVQSGGAITALDSIELIYTTKFASLPDYSRQVNVSSIAKYLAYQVVGLQKIHYTPISHWPIPTAFSPVQELEPNLTANHAAYLYDKGLKKVFFRKNAIVSEPIIIPEGHTVTFEPGTKIDIIKKAFILSYSTVYFLGTEQQPIFVNSSDGSARSFTVIGANELSKVNYTTFSNFGAFSYKGWNLPGAINFYESDVNIYHTTFTKNSCEDALNIVRSDFDFRHNTISHTFADGFDADFCHGTVANCYFYKTGNDAIDFSTTVVTIKDSKIEYAGDKGISIGEQGTATIVNTSIDHTVIGIASKDLSKTTVNSVTLKNCKTGFSAYQKKPEYGHGFIYVQSYTGENLGAVHKILPGSYLKLIDVEIKGD